jgi:hypothetical protein
MVDTQSSLSGKTIGKMRSLQVVPLHLDALTVVRSCERTITSSARFIRSQKTLLDGQQHIKLDISMKSSSFA